MPETNMQHAMNAAGITTPDQRRRQLRQDAIKRARTPHEALELYRESLESDPQAALTLFSLSEIATRARQDINGAWPSTGHGDASHRDAGGGHCRHDTYRRSAPAETTRGPSAPGVGGQRTCDTQRACAPGSANTPPPRRTGNAARAAGRPRRSGEDLDRTGVGREMRKCALNRVRINGKPLRYADPEEALQQAENWHIEARTVEAICTGLVPGVPVGEQISDDEANTREDRASKTTV